MNLNEAKLPQSVRPIKPPQIYVFIGFFKLNKRMVQLNWAVEKNQI